MRRMGLFEAKQKLSELVERATRGERIGITKRGKRAAMIGPAQEEVGLKKVFARVDGDPEALEKAQECKREGFDRTRKRHGSIQDEVVRRCGIWRLRMVWPWRSDAGTSVRPMLKMRLIRFCGRQRAK